MLARMPRFTFDSNAPHLQTTFAAGLVLGDHRHVEIYNSEMSGSAAGNEQTLIRSKRTFLPRPRRRLPFFEQLECLPKFL
jgi:hypothetical protein